MTQGDVKNFQFTLENNVAIQFKRKASENNKPHAEYARDLLKQYIEQAEKGGKLITAKMQADIITFFEVLNGQSSDRACVDSVSQITGIPASEIYKLVCDFENYDKIMGLVNDKSKINQVERFLKNESEQ